MVKIPMAATQNNAIFDPPSIPPLDMVSLCCSLDLGKNLIRSLTISEKLECRPILEKSASGCWPIKIPHARASRPIGWQVVWLLNACGEPCAQENGWSERCILTAMNEETPPTSIEKNPYAESSFQPVTSLSRALPPSLATELTDHDPARSSPTDDSASPSISSATEALRLRVAMPMARRSWQRGLDRLCRALESGSDWDNARRQIAGEPNDLLSLLDAGAQAGHPGSIALAVIERQHQLWSSWRQLRISLLYPTLILIFALICGSIISQILLSFVDINTFISNQSASVIRDFKDAAIGLMAMVFWLGFLGATVYMIATPLAWLKIIGSVPLLGRPYRWLSMSDFLARIAVFIQHRPVLSDTLHLTALSYGSRGLAPVAEYVDRQIKAGSGFRNALHQTVLSDPRAGMALTIIEMKPDDFSSSIHRASHLLEAMSEQTCARLRIIYPLFVIFMTASIIWAAWASYFVVYTSVLQSLL